MKFFYKENVLRQIDAAVKAVMDKRLVPKIVWLNRSLYETLMRTDPCSRFRRVLITPPLRFYADAEAMSTAHCTTVEYEIRCRHMEDRIYVETEEPLPNQIKRGIDNARIKNLEVDYVEIDRQELEILKWQLDDTRFPLSKNRTTDRGEYMTLFGTRIELEGNCSL